MIGRHGRTAAAAALLAVLWAAGGALLFLVGPVLSRFSPAWGAAAGLLALALQLAWGERLVRGLLRLQPGPPEASGLQGWIDEERPFLLALGGAPDLVATRGLLDGSAADLPELVAMLRRARGGASGWLLTRALALPCLLRAFEAVTASYGRLRGGAGPLWFLGRAFLVLASLLEAPLRPLELPPPGPEEGGRLRLEEALARHGALPAWMEALALLAPVTPQGARRRALLEALGGLAPGQAVPVSREDRLARQAPWLGLLAGLLLAALPGGPLAAPLVLLSLGLALRAWRELPPGPAVEGDLAALWDLARRRGRGVPVRLGGRLVEPPEGLARSGTWMQAGDGRVLLQEAPAPAEGPIEVTGWMRPAQPGVLVGTLEASGRRRRSFPLARRLLVPLELGLLGAAWWILQVAGL